MAVLPERLWKLQSELLQLRELEGALSEKPADFAELDERFSTSASELASLEAKLEEMQKSRRETERELQSQQEVLVRYQGQLMQVKNQQQYAAAWKEIDTARKGVKELEDAALQKMQEIEELEARISSARSELEPLAEEHKASHKKWQNSLGDLRRKRDGVKERISDIEKDVPPNVLKEFHGIAKQRGGVAMTRVVGSSCESCRVNIRPALYQQLRRGDLTRCEGCRRMLYVETEQVAVDS